LAKEDRLNSPTRSGFVLAVAEQAQNHLLATKFLVPSPARALIPRLALHAVLAESLNLPLTLISAPAGYGKTTLLADFARQTGSGFHTAWVSLDQADRDARCFWRYVLTALDHCQPGLTDPALQLIEKRPALPLAEMLTALINAISQSQAQYLLILDNLDLADEPPVQSSLNYLLEHQPPQLHLVLSTRRDPPLNLSRLRANNQLLEIRVGQLRCSEAETALFLKEITGIELPPGAAAKIAERTEGWLAGLQLMCLALRSQPGGAGGISSLNGSQRYILDYLNEEVIQRQPAAVRSFLMRTSILRQLSAPLCDAVMDSTGSQAMLEALDQSNLFLQPLDDQRQGYRYHSLFAEALRSLLQREEKELIPDLQLRASRWYAGQNQVLEAIRYALQARAYQAAADLMEALTETGPTRALKQVWGQSEEIPSMLDWLGQLPAEIVQMRPRLGLYYARLLASAGQSGEVAAWVQAAETALDHLAEPCDVEADQAGGPVSLLHPSDPGPEETRRLRGEIAAQRALTASLHGQPNRAGEFCRAAESELREKDLAQQALLACAYAEVELSRGQAAPAIRSLSQAAAALRQCELPAAEINTLSQAASLLQMQGRLHESQQLLQQAIELASAHSPAPGAPWPLQGLAGPAYLALADVLREWNQLDRALELAQQGMGMLEVTRNRQFADVGEATLARIHLSMGNAAPAQAALRRSRLLPALLDNPYRRSWLLSVEQARTWLKIGELEAAAHWAEELEQMERPASSFAREREDLAHARICLGLGQPRAARELLAAHAPAIATAKRFGHLLELRLLEAQACAALKDEAASQAALAEALRMAEPEGSLRPFLDEGAPLAELLQRLRDRQARQKTNTAFIDLLLAEFQKEGAGAAAQPGHSIQDPLSAREMEVLHQLATGSSNHEIAGSLVLSVETVKRHVGNILAKLEANNRTQAVARARSLGLIN
jgi:LuxR family transcriptional regulator, maltose regulon positive regulatory protein